MRPKEACEMVHDIVYHDGDHQKAHEIENFIESQAQEIEKLQTELDEAKKDNDTKQAKIDALMFEYCHEEMTDNQLLEYERAQAIAILNPPVKEEE